MIHRYPRFLMGMLGVWLAILGILPWAQGQNQAWQDVNRGFGKCAAIGQSAGTAFWADDGFEVMGLMHRAGQVYAFVQYRPDALNTQPCGGGLFRHDSTSGQWIKVAGDPRTGRNLNLVYSEEGIWLLAEGRVYAFSPDYGANPTGWRQVGSGQLLYSQVFTCPCTPSACPNPVSFQGGLEYESAAFGDTLFVLMRAKSDAACTDDNKVGKFSLTAGTWTFQTIGKLPNQGIAAAGGLSGADRNGRFHYGNRIAGRLCWFFADSELGKSRCLPLYLWVWDGGWKNISQGVDWTNQPGTSNPEQCVSLTRPAADWGPGGGLWLDNDRRQVYASSEQGIWRWGGNGWVFVSRQEGNSTVYPTATGLFIHNKGRLSLVSSPNTASLPALFADGCAYNRAELLVSPNGGRSLYAVKRGMKAACQPDSASAIQQGIARINFQNDKPATTTNLHIQTGTYLGGPGANEPIGVGIGGKQHVFVAGNFDLVKNRADAPCQSFLFNGATPQSKGRIIRLNALGDSVISVSTLGDAVQDYEIQNYGLRQMAASGSFGVSLLDSGGIQLWRVPGAQIPGSSRILVDVDDAGRVAVLRGGSQGANGEVLGPAQIAIFGDDGTAQTDFATVQGSFVTDIALRNDTVFVTGYTVRTLDDPSPCPGGTNTGAAVDVAFVRAYRRSGRALTQIWNSFDFSGSELDRDPGDTRGYRLNFGKNGGLYFLGESGGGSSAFRWNGKTTVSLNGCADPASPLVITDSYTNPAGTEASAAYYAILNTATGEVRRSQFLFPRGVDGQGAAFQTSRGYIHADAAGFVYLGDQSAERLAGRASQQVNGRLVDAFFDSGDMTLAILNPDLSERVFWGTFSARQGQGRTVGIGIGANTVAVLGKPKGTMYTGGTRNGAFSPASAMHAVPFNPDPGQATPDAYLALWQADAWNGARLDTLQERALAGLPVIPQGQFNNRVNFTASPRVVCINSPVQFTNSSINDSTGWVWSFGTDASLPPGTTGAGPHSVSWSTPGRKPIRLQAILHGNVTDVEERSEVIVLASLPPLGAIAGTRSVCSGTELVYSVPPMDGITEYNWTFPAGFRILAGEGSATVRVLTGGAGGNVSVFGRTPCANTTVSNLQVSVQNAETDRIILVAGNSPLSVDDQRIKQHLQNQGYEVLEVLDSTTGPGIAGCAALVIIAPTATRRGTHFKFRDVATPVIVLNADLFADMGLTYGGTNDVGLEPGREGQVINSSHELGKGIPLGLRPLYTQAFTFQWGTPGSEAVLIAHSQTGPMHAFALGYEEGAAMRGHKAPARRAGLFIAMDGFRLLARDGFVLFDNAVCWALRNCPATVTIATGALSRAGYCPTDTVRVPFSVTGILNSDNTFLVQLSDGQGNFAHPTTIGNLASATTSGIIKAIIPVGITSGTGYRVRVVSSNPSVLGSNNGANLSIGLLPATPAGITGPNTGCLYQAYNYTVTPVAGATVYLWDVPIGASIVGAPPGQNQFLTTKTTITVEFGSHIFGHIAVWSVNNCGQSSAGASLIFNFTNTPPQAPQAIQGPDTVCNVIPAAYSVQNDPTAVRYQWLLPQGVSTPSTTSSGVLSFSGIPDDSTITLHLRAMNGCGYGPWQTRQVRVDNQASIPPISGLVFQNGVCPGVINFSVGAVPNATGYTWLLPPEAHGTSTSNTIEVTFDTASQNIVRVFAQTPCGNTDTLDIPVNIPNLERRALLYVRQPSPLTAGDSSLRLRLQHLGFVVEVATDASPIDARARCNRVIVVSAAANDADQVARLASLPVPLLANQNLNGSATQMTELRLTPSGSSANGIFNIGSIILNPTPHPILEGLLASEQYPYNAISPIGWGNPGPAAQPLAQLPTGAPRIPLFAYETGAQMIGLAAPARRVGFFLNTGGLLNIRPEGLRLFDNAICWLTDGCIAQTARITSTTLNARLACAGGTVEIPFTVTGAFGAGNEFTAILSDRAGNFSPGLTLSPSLPATGSGTLTVALPDTLSPGGSYRIKIVSSQPYTQGEPVALPFTIIKVNTGLSVSATRVCPGEPATVVIAPTEVNVVYQAFVNGQPVSDTLRTDGFPARITIPSQGPGAIITVRAQGGSCPPVYLTDTASYRTLPQPGPIQGLKVLDSVCSGSPAVLSGLRGESGILYTFYLGATPIDSVRATTAPFQFNIPPGLLQPGPNTFAVSGRRGNCPAWPITEEPYTLYLVPPADTTLAVTGGRFCSDDSIAITLSGPEAGTRYALFNGSRVIPARQSRFGPSLIFTIDSTAFAGADSLVFRIQATPPSGCRPRFLAQTATILLTPFFELHPPILGDSGACLNSLAEYRVNLSGLPVDSIAWSIPRTANLLSGQGTPDISLRYTQYPNPKDTLRVFARAGCGILIGKKAITLDCERLFIPNIFTPLTVDRNNVWDIRGLDAFPKFHLQVFNTAGQRVHQLKNTFTPWDGRFNGSPLPSGTYYFVLDLGDGFPPQTGSVTIIR